MTRRGFSLAKGSGRNPLPVLKSAGALMPPVYSGMVPSLLPAFSAPVAVSVVPSCLASSAETALQAVGAASDASAAIINVLRNMIVFLSECRFECERYPAAVGQLCERTVGRTHHAACRSGHRRVRRVIAEVAVVAELHLVLLVDVGHD